MARRRVSMKGGAQNAQTVLLSEKRSHCSGKVHEASLCPGLPGGRGAPPNLPAGLSALEKRRCCTAPARTAGHDIHSAVMHSTVRHGLCKRIAVRCNGLTVGA